MNDLPSDEREALERATGEYLSAQRLNADQPEAHVNLGNLAAKRGDRARAEQAYHAALGLDPDWVPAYVNLADVLREAGRDGDGERVLRAGLARLPDAAALHHALGLLQVRQKNLPGALVTLRRAAELAPDDARFSYVYAVALENAGRRQEALSVVEKTLRRAPAERDLKALRSELTAGGPGTQ